MSLLMVVHDLNVFRSAWRPPEADTELLVDPDAVLANTVAPKCLQAVAGGDPEILQAARDLDLT